MRRLDGWSISSAASWCSVASEAKFTNLVKLLTRGKSKKIVFFSIKYLKNFEKIRRLNLINYRVKIARESKIIIQDFSRKIVKILLVIFKILLIFLDLAWSLKFYKVLYDLL